MNVGNSVGDGGELGGSIAKANGVSDLQKYIKAHDFCNLRKSKSVKGKIYSQIEAHHLICSEAMDDEEEVKKKKSKAKKGSEIYTWMELCNCLGYDINCKENGVYLPSCLEVACAHKVPLHRGNHEATYGEGNENYVDSVKKLIKPFKDNAKSYCNDPGKFKEHLDSISSDIFDCVKEFIWTITADGRDYKGKIGCLNCTSFASKRKKVLGNVLSGTALSQVEKATLKALADNTFCNPKDHDNPDLKFRKKYNLTISK